MVSNTIHSSLSLSLLMLAPLPHLIWAQPATASPVNAASASVPSAEHFPAGIKVQITDKQAHSFHEALSALAQQAHVTFVVEAEPLHLTLGPTTRIDLTPDGEPLSSLVPKVAAAYDYEATRSGSVFLLTKRFSDPADIPDVTLAECSQAMDDVALILAPFDPHFKRGQIEKSPAIQDLLSSLTPEQMAALQDKQHGLAVASLPPNQQQGVEQLVLFLYVQLPLGNTTSAMQQVKSVSQGTPVFCRRNFSDVAPGASKVGLGDIHLFGIKFLDISAGKVSFIPLSKPNNISSSQGAIAVTWSGFTNGKAILSDNDPTDPPPPALPVPHSGAAVTAVNSETLREVVARLNVGTASKPKLAVDAALAPKRVAVFGEQFTPPLRIFDALAELYGLRVRHSDDEKSLRLARRLFQVPLTPEGISLAIQALMPAPLIRARQNYLGRQPAPLHIAAVRALRTVIEPKLKASKTGRVSLSELSSRENMALATALMADTARTLEDAFSQPFPPGVLNPNILRLAGTIQEQNGRRTIDLHLALPSLESKDTLVMGPGVGNMVIGP